MRLWMLLLCLWLCVSASAATWSQRALSVIQASWDDLNRRIDDGDDGDGLFRRLLAIPLSTEGRPQTLTAWQNHHPITTAEYPTVSPWFELLGDQLKKLQTTT